MTRRSALPLLLALALAACGGGDRDGPAEVTCEAEWGPAAPRAGELVRLRLALQPDRPLRAQARLLLGWPHPYYALSYSAPGDGFPPSPIDPATVTANEPVQVRRWQAEQGHWYLLASPLGGGDVELDVPGIRVPNATWRGFGPLILLDEAGDGGYRRICAEVGVDVEPGAPVALRAVVPSSADKGEEITVGLRLEDRFGNPTGELGGEAMFRVLPRSPSSRMADLRRPIEPGPVPGTGRFSFPIRTYYGAHWVEVWLPGGPDGVPRALSNPIRLSPGPQRRVVWADIHAHSGLADGWGSPAELYAYARDVAFVDVASVTEHDWQLDPDEAVALRAATGAANDPGRFVTLPALEINLRGHEVAYFFDGAALEERSPAAAGGVTSVWEETDLGRPGAGLEPSASELVAGYPEQDLLLVTHSSLAPGMGTSLPLDEPLPGWQAIEIYSAHGNNECPECPRSAGHGNDPEAPTGSVRDAIDAGAVLGFIAAGDSHDGRPGNSRWGRDPGGLTALLVDELTRDGVEEALRERRTWATTGERMLIEFELGGLPMGSVVQPGQVGPMRFRVATAEPVSGIDLVHDGAARPIRWWPVANAWQGIPDPQVPGPGYYYLRVRLAGGGMGWTSPIFVRGADE